MKYIIFLSVLIFNVLISNDTNLTKASWYGPGFHGRVTANGEVYNQDDLTCASTQLPFNTMLVVINTDNAKSVVVRVNDRGPYKMNKKGKVLRPLQKHPVRGLDLSKKAFSIIAPLDKGVINVKYYILNE